MIYLLSKDKLDIGTILSIDGKYIFILDSEIYNTQFTESDKYISYISWELNSNPCVSNTMQLSTWIEFEADHSKCFKNSNAFLYVNKQTVEMAKLAIKSNITNIAYCDRNYLEDMIDLYPHGIQYLAEMSKNVAKIAVSKEPYLIKYIKYPDDELCDIVIKKNITSAWHINNPSDKTILKILNEFPFYINEIKNPTIEMMKTAISSCPSAIEYIKDAPDEIKIFAIERDFHTYHIIKDLRFLDIAKQSCLREHFA